MRKDGYNTLTEVVREALIYDAPKVPLKAVAADLGKPYYTLTRELNTEDDGAKLGADLLLPIMRITGDIRPLEWLADRLGYALRPESAIRPDRDSWQDEHVQDTQRFGEMSRLMDEGASPEAVDRARRELIREIEETAKRYRENWERREVRIA